MCQRERIGQAAIIYKGSISAPQVGNHKNAIAESDHSMLAADMPLRDADVIRGRPPNTGSRPFDQYKLALVICGRVLPRYFGNTLCFAGHT